MDAGLQEQLNDLRRRLITLNSQYEKADNVSAPSIEMENVLISIEHLEAEIEKEQTQPKGDSQM